MFKEKLIGKPRLEAIREYAYELEERINRGEIDAEKTVEMFYKVSLDYMVFYKFVAILLVGIGSYLVGAWIFQFADISFIGNVIGVILVFAGTYLFFGKGFYPTEIKLFFKKTHEIIQKTP